MLTPTKVSLGNIDIMIIPTIILCMIDRKVCNAVSCSSAQCCYMCGAKPTEMNNINILSRKETKNIFHLDYHLFMSGLEFLNVFFIFTT